MLDFTISLWFKAGTARLCSPRPGGADSTPMQNWRDGCGLLTPPEVGTTKHARGAGEGGERSPRNDFGLSLSPRGEILFGVGERASHDGDHTLVVTPNMTLRTDDGQWHHVVAVRRAEPASLRLFLDGVEHRCGGGGGNARCVGGPASAGPMADAPHRLAVGAGLRGCLRDVRLKPIALSGGGVRRLMARTALTPAAGEGGAARIRLYYSYDPQQGGNSTAMHNFFLSSLAASGNGAAFEPVLVPIDRNATGGAARWANKLKLVVDAIAAGEPDELIVVTDIDVREWVSG